MAATKRSDALLSLDPLPTKKLRHITAEGGEEFSRELTREERLSSLLAGLPFQAEGTSLLPPEAGSAPLAAVAAQRSGQHWRELTEQLAAAQEELNIMLDVIQQVEAGKLVTIENVQRPKPTLGETKEDVGKRVGMKHAAMQAAQGRLQAVADRIKGKVDTDQTFYDGLRRLQAHWKVKRLVSHSRVRFLVDLTLPPSSKRSTAHVRRFAGRSSLPERDRAATEVEVTPGKDGQLAALVEAHRPQWELVIAIHEQLKHKLKAEERERGRTRPDETDVSMDDPMHVADVSMDDVAPVAGVSESNTGAEDEVDKVHARLRGLQSGLLAERVFDSLLEEAISQPPSGALVVRANTHELELSLAHGQRLHVQLRRKGVGAFEERLEEHSAKAVEARAFLMGYYLDARYGQEKKAQGEGTVADRGTEAVGALSFLCSALQAEHAWSFLQHRVQQTIRSIRGATVTACAPSLFRSGFSGWWLAVHVASSQVVHMLNDGVHCQIWGQDSPRHFEINAADSTPYVQDEIARFQIRRAHESALQHELAAELRGHLTVVVSASMEDNEKREEWATLRQPLSLESRTAVSEIERAEIWLSACPTCSSGGIGWTLTYKEEQKGWRGRREGLKSQDVALSVALEADCPGKAGDWLRSLRNFVSYEGMHEPQV